MRRPMRDMTSRHGTGGAVIQGFSAIGDHVALERCDQTNNTFDDGQVVSIG